MGTGEEGVEEDCDMECPIMEAQIEALDLKKRTRLKKATEIGATNLSISSVGTYEESSFSPNIPFSPPNVSIRGGKEVHERESLSSVEFSSMSSKAPMASLEEPPLTTEREKI